MPATPFHVFLSHGLESGPGGTKVQAMKAVADTFETLVLADGHRLEHSVPRIAQEFRDFIKRCLGEQNPD